MSVSTRSSASDAHHSGGVSPSSNAFDVSHEHPRQYHRSTTTKREYARRTSTRLDAPPPVLLHTIESTSPSASSTVPASGSPALTSKSSTTTSTVTFHAAVVTPSTPSAPYVNGITRATPSSILKTRTSSDATTPKACEAVVFLIDSPLEASTTHQQQHTLEPSDLPILPLPLSSYIDVCDLSCNPSPPPDFSGLDGGVSCSSSSSGCTNSPVNEVCTTVASYESIVAEYRPVYPSLRLIITQLQQTSLWDRLFTHCTGRDLLCKIVQHSCGLLRCMLQFWNYLLKRLVQYAAFRRMFFRGRDIKQIALILPPAGLLTPLPKVAVATEKVVASSSFAAEVESSSTVDEWVPPSSDDSLLFTAAHRLNYISYTMYRARQVLRLGRWLYDIPDVKDSALELWYGHSEEKSLEDQEEEEEWEEHERVHVVRNPSRRMSVEFNISNAGSRTPAGTGYPRDANAGGLGNSTGGGGGGRGNFLFLPTSRNSILPTSSHMNRSSSLPQLQPLQQPPSSNASASSLDDSLTILDRHVSHSSIASTASSSSSDDIVSPRERLRIRTSDEDETTTMSTGSESPSADVEEEEDDSMTVLEWTVGLIDLTNSLMGLIIDAADDVEFISSLGVFSSHVGELAGNVSAYLWVASGAVDVAMCCYKLHAYRQEMREALIEKLQELKEEEDAKVKKFLGDVQEKMNETAQVVAATGDGDSGESVVLTEMCDSTVSSRQSSANAHPSSTLLVPASTHRPSSSLFYRYSKSTTTPTLSPFTLCTHECDVDCFHIEYIRLYRYIGELGLSVCGVLIDETDKLHPLQGLLEASGLFSGIATFVKRGATHARSKRWKPEKSSLLSTAAAAAAATPNDDASREDSRNSQPSEEDLYS